MIEASPFSAQSAPGAPAALGAPWTPLAPWTRLAFLAFLAFLALLAAMASQAGVMVTTARAQYEAEADSRSVDRPSPGDGRSREVDGRALASAIAGYDRREPRVDRVVRAALAAGAPSLVDVRALVTRARLAGLLPSLRVGAQRGTGWDLSERLDDNGRVQIGTDDELSLRAEAVFSLDRLLFAREEVPLSREVRAVQLARRGLIEAVIRLYYERRRLMLERDLLGAGGVAATMRIDEATALLDAFTRGRFRRMLRGP